MSRNPTLRKGAIITLKKRILWCLDHYHSLKRLLKDCFKFRIKYAAKAQKASEAHNIYAVGLKTSN